MAKKNTKEIERMGYAMTRAYNRHPGWETACAEVTQEFPNVDTETLKAMWFAIDSYVDVSAG